MLSAEKAVAGSSDLIHDLVERVSNARLRSDALFGIVRDGALYERPIPERHRIMFYIGHLEAFDWNLLGSGTLGLQSRSPELDRLFAFGIDPVGGGLPADLPSDWPSLDVVRGYVSDVRSNLDAHLQDVSLGAESATRDGFPMSTLMNVAVEHRLMHVETLAYMLHQLPLAAKVPQLDPPFAIGPPVSHQTISIPAGVAALGLARGDSFGWDNEYLAHAVEVPAFEIDRYKVTNRQYLEFVAAGGYDTPSFWTGDDWNWKTERGIAHPLFWRRGGDRWLVRCMFREVPMDGEQGVLDWPVYVSQAEASAYARWAGKGLPSEAEWQRAAYGDGAHDLEYPRGSEEPSARVGNFDFRRWDPTPVNAFPRGQSALGVDDLLGNGWEWTSTLFGPFAGFEPFPFYRGYSADFFDGKHFVMKGGSSRTAACMLRPSFRNWFQPHYQYVYAGFRCVKR
jgi:iron(II)-dependent oxidoreductase